MKNIYRILCISSLGVLLSSAVAQALVPLMGVAMMTLGAIISGTGLLAGYSIYQGIYPGTGSAGSGSAYVTPSGTIGRDATVQWVDLTSGLPEVKMKEVTVKANASSVMDAAKANPTKYPKLATASSVSAPLQPGTIVRAPDPWGTFYNWNIISFNKSWDQCYNRSDFYVHMNVLTTSNLGGSLSCSGSESSYTFVQWNVQQTNNPVSPSLPATPSQFAQKLANSSSSLSSLANVFSDYYGEIDDYIKEFPGSVSVVDGPSSSISDSASPAVLPTPATQTAYNAAESKAASAAASAAARESANGAVSTAQLNYNNNPTAENEQKLKDAIAARDKLLADQSKDAAGDADKEASEEEDKERISGSGFVGDDPYGDSEKDFDLGNRFKTFFDEMKTTAVFSLPNEFLTNIPNSSETSISFNGGRFGVQTFDFATFSSLWNGLKAVILVAFGWFAIRIAVLKGGSS